MVPRLRYVGRPARGLGLCATQTQSSYTPALLAGRLAAYMLALGPPRRAGLCVCRPPVMTCCTHRWAEAQQSGVVCRGGPEAAAQSKGGQERGV